MFCICIYFHKCICSDRNAQEDLNRKRSMTGRGNKIKLHRQALLTECQVNVQELYSDRKWMCVYLLPTFHTCPC